MAPGTKSTSFQVYNRHLSASFFFPGKQWSPLGIMVRITKTMRELEKVSRCWKRFPDAIQVSVIAYYEKMSLSPSSKTAEHRCLLKKHNNLTHSTFTSCKKPHIICLYTPWKYGSRFFPRIILYSFARFLFLFFIKSNEIIYTRS